MEVSADFNRDGLIIHEVDLCLKGGETLGIEIDGAKYVTRNCWERFAKIRKSIVAILNMHKVSGWILEVLVGHCIYFSLCRRDLLCIFIQSIFTSVPITASQHYCGRQSGQNSEHSKV
jgi:hypothetical protein